MCPQLEDLCKSKLVLMIAQQNVLDLLGPPQSPLLPWPEVTTISNGACSNLYFFSTFSATWIWYFVSSCNVFRFIFFNGVCMSEQQLVQLSYYLCRSVILPSFQS